MSFLSWLWGDSDDSEGVTLSSNQNDWSGFNIKTDGYDGTSVYNQITEITGEGDLNTSQGIYETAKWNPLKNENVLGLPLHYNDLADPNGRIYNSTIIQDAPLLFMIPGVATLNKGLIDSAGNKMSPLKLAKRLANLGDNGFSIGVKGVKDGNDLRYLGFKADYSDYFKYVQTMLSDVFSYMKMSVSSNVFDIFRFSNEFKNSYGSYGLCYYTDKSTSVSETASNTYGESRMQQMVNEKNSTAREASVLGRGGFSKWSSSLIEGIKSLSVTAVLDSFKSYEGIIARTSNSLFRVVNGSQLYFPQIWQDSRFDRSYNIAFKFFSPYGDKMSIFKYLYVPLISLLAFTLPRQDSVLAYNEPFLAKIFCPGKFDIPMGAVQSLTINKGGSDNLWTKDGLPREIDVTMDVIDMYPTLTQIESPGLMRYNLSLSSYLETMAGIRPDQISVAMQFKAQMNRSLSSTGLLDAPNSIKNFVDDGLYNFQSSITDRFFK